MAPDDEPLQSHTLFGRGPQTCPICATALETNAAADSPLYPFCSRRCKLIDLARWTEGRYAVVETLTLERLLEEQARAESDVHHDAP